MGDEVAGIYEVTHLHHAVERTALVLSSRAGVSPAVSCWIPTAEGEARVGGGLLCTALGPLTLFKFYTYLLGLEERHVSENV